MVEPEAPDAALFPARVGDRLRSARIKAGLDISDVATRTRVPQRHLQAIESGDYAALPSTTYCVGFVKAYARAVGEDETDLGRLLRGELGDTRADARYDLPGYEDADPVRMPSRLLAWTAAGLALLVAIGWGVWRSEMLKPSTAASIVAEAPSQPALFSPPQATQLAPKPAGQVALTATKPVWVRIYDADDKVLLQKEMAQGERYDVPANANNPQIRTGRADLISVTVDGKPVSALGPPEHTIKNVGISAAALAARAPPPPEPGGNAFANP